ncbi:hypothetical protein [Streptomyces sp. NRRL WC-3742]|uniref:hypothetical protein n=1 Tax=Streptomyces sp. NRRL WC-3742 TaxID=1463934 RepID=UPI0004C9AD93|nr:hypothetical protein [Streptomyces sp. NRRL WC-3742]
MRILVDGLDLSGKTTLTHALVGEFADRGVPAVRHRGMLAHHHPIEPILKRLPLFRQPDSSLITTAFLGAGYALDALLVKADPPQPRGTVLVQDGYADRTVAFGIAGGPYLAAVLGLRWPALFAPFDLAVYVHAPIAVRRKRVAGREDIDANDRRSVEDRPFADLFNAVLLHGMGRRHRRLLVFDTAEHSPQQMARQIADAALATASTERRTA